MYEVYADDYLLYSSTIENLKIINPKLELEDNKSGSFTFTIYPDHPYYAQVNKLSSYISVYQDGFRLFYGRVLNDEIGFRNEKDITCEGALSFFLDSIIRPYDFTGSITDFLTMIINAHNTQMGVASNKRFTLGTVTVTDPNDYIVRSSIEYAKSWDVIEDKLLNMLGGHIIVRYASGVNYIDYLADYTTESSQTIQFAKNLLDLKLSRNGEDIITALIPLGAKLQDSEGSDTDERLTIASVNSGLDYIYNQDAVNSYGWVFGTQTWDDVTVASNLLTKGQAYLASQTSFSNTIELSAADLAGIDQNVTSFHLGTYVRVTSNPHGIDQRFLVTKLSIKLLNPASNSLTLGGTLRSFTEQTNGIGKTQAEIIGQMSKTATDTSQAIHQVEVSLESEIQQTEKNIIARVAEEYYQKDETDSLISAISTTVSLNKDSVDILFDQYKTDLQDLSGNTDTNFKEIQKYIRFIDGKILLGEVGNELELKISNDRISFLQSNSEVAYFSDNKLYVTDGEFTNTLRLGNFAFIPRENGNLSFKKII